ncbi:30S ribosomal protein S2 [Mycoplasmopsis equigenitalium]
MARVLKETHENSHSKEEGETTKKIVSKEKLLESGAYFGHKTSFRNPSMQQFIHMAKFGTHIIDLTKTTIALEFAYKIINKAAQKNASFIFVGTKKQAKKVTEEQAIRTNSFYVTERWLGGTFTNHNEIFKRVGYLENLEELEKNGFAGYTKKEALDKTKELEKLRTNLTGIRKMKYLPHFMIIADPLENRNAIREARQKGIKIIGIADTNFNPNLLDVAIPANDDSAKSIQLIITVLADAIATAQGQKAKFAYEPDEKIVFDAEEEKETKDKKTFTKKPFNSNQKQSSNWKGARQAKTEENGGK